MNALKVYPLLLALAGIIWLSCNKENNPALSEGSPVKVAFTGQITDENGTPLTGAVVTAGTAMANTDANGVFRLDQVTLPDRNAILNVSLDGYFNFSRAWFVENNAVQQVSIHLLEKKMVQGFFSDKAAVAQVGAAQINFPANSVARPDGSAYDGAVYIFARYLDPTDPNLHRRMPGDLRGIGKDGAEQTLATFGMIAVELTTPGGEPLQIAAGKEVEVTMPIPVEKLAAAPAEIPLWYFDVEKSRWIEEGSALKTGNEYVGKVKHFSFWNCDDPFPVIGLTGKVYFGDDKTPLSGATIRLTIKSSGWHGYGLTNENGFFGGGVPKDEVMQLAVLLPGQCGGQSIYTQTIGPFGQDVILPAIIVPALNLETINVSGRLVGCNQQPVENGYILVFLPGSSQTILAGADGTINQNITTCDQNTDLNIIAFDPTDGKQSEVLSFTNISTALQTGDIGVCANSGEYFNIVFKGKTYSFLDSIQAGRDADYTFISSSTQPFISACSLTFNSTGQTGDVAIRTFHYANSIEAFGGGIGTVHVMTFGAVGQKITGSLEGTSKDSNGQVFPLAGSFQVIRDY